MYISGDNDTVIVDIGTITYKTGYSNQDLPSRYGPSKGIHRSVINNINDYLDILSNNIPSDTSYLLVSENTFEDPNNKKHILEYVFENNLCDSIMFSKSCILDLISYGKTSGINVCISGGSVQVCSVIDGYVVKKDKIEKGLVGVMEKYYRKYCEIKRSCFDVDNDSLDNVYGSGSVDVGNVRNVNMDNVYGNGDNIDVDNNNINIINDIFNKNNLIYDIYNSNNSINDTLNKNNLINDVSNNNISIKNISTNNTLNKNILNKNIYNIYNLKTTLLEQSYIDLKNTTNNTTLQTQFRNTHSFIYKIKDIISETPQDKQNILLNNIVISGYGSYIDNKYIQEGLGDYKFINVPSRFHTFSGGCVLSNIGSVKSLHVGRRDYREYGCSILDRKRYEWGV